MQGGRLGVSRGNGCWRIKFWFCWLCYCFWNISMLLWRHNITLFSFLLLGLMPQLIAEMQHIRRILGVAYQQHIWHTQVLDQGRAGILAIRQCNTSNCKYKCNTCKYKCLCSAIPAANAAGAEVQKRGRQKRGQTFPHSSPDNDTNQPKRSPNLIANQSMVKWNLFLCKEAPYVVEKTLKGFSRITLFKMSDVWGDLDPAGSVECVTAVNWWKMV